MFLDNRLPTEICSTWLAKQPYAERNTKHKICEVLKIHPKAQAPDNQDFAETRCLVKAAKDKHYVSYHLFRKQNSWQIQTGQKGGSGNTGFIPLRYYYMN